MAANFAHPLLTTFCHNIFSKFCPLISQLFAEKTLHWVGDIRCCTPHERNSFSSLRFWNLHVTFIQSGLHLCFVEAPWKRIQHINHYIRSDPHCGLFLLYQTWDLLHFLFVLLGAAIVFCTYCYVKPLRYLIIRKTSNSIKTLRTHRILKLQNRNKTWNLSCNNIPKIIQLTHTLFHSLVTSKSNRTDFPHSNSTVFCFQSLWRFGRKDFEGTSWTQIIPYNYEYWLQNWMSFSIL